MIPVSRPSVSDAEIAAVADVLRSGWWGTGPVGARFETAFAAAVGARRAVATSSATTALTLALRAVEAAGREVISPSLTFVGANHAILHAGARPVFADVRPDDLTIDPDDVERRITSATAAIVAMDYAGQPADLLRLRELADVHGIALIEDAAHATGASLGGRPVGSIATLTCFSFHAVKPLSTGEGGAVTTDDDALADRVRRLRWFGIERDTWRRVSGDRYDWSYDVDEIGYKANLSDVAAAIGLAQLGRLDAMQAARTRRAGRYTDALGDLRWLSLPTVRDGSTSAWHLYVVRLDAADRDAFIDHLAGAGVATSVHYRPSHLAAVYRPFAGPLPVSEREWRRVVSLPMFTDLTDVEQDRVIEAVRAFRPAAVTAR